MFVVSMLILVETAINVVISNNAILVEGFLNDCFTSIYCVYAARFRYFGRLDSDQKGNPFVTALVLFLIKHIQHICLTTTTNIVCSLHN